MKLKLIAATALLSLSTAAFALDSQFERTLNVNAQPDLYVSTGSGNIQVHSGAGNQIHVVGHIHAGWGALGDIKSRIQRITDNPPIMQEGNSIKIGMENDHDLYNHISIDYDISIPTGTALNLKSGSGDVNIDGASPRYLSASSGSGNVTAHGVHGAAELSAGSGDIVLDEDAPGDVRAKSGSGSIRIHGFNGGLNARTGSGDIEASGHLIGAATLASGSGNVHLHLTPDAHFNLEASTGSGDIRVHFPNAPQQSDNSKHHMTAAINGGGPVLEVRTGSGDIGIDSN
jgi:DUF4097 and DUF4098 domain-containing protein YvlB